MTEGTSLDDLLSGEPIDAPVEQTEPVEDRARDEHGRFAAKETGVEPEQVIEPEPVAVPPTDKLPKEEYKAIREEREKRQNLERELETLKRAIQEQQNPPEPPPSVFEDEQGWQAHFGNQVVSTAVQQATLNAKLDMSEMMVRQANPDFEEVKAEFLALAEQNPVLRQQALSDPHPWNKAYQIAKNHRAMQELGATNLDDLKAKIRDELMAEMQASPAPRASVPPSLASERNVGQRTGPQWTGPKSLSDMLR